MKERTLSIIKPDGVAKNLIGEVIRRIEAKGLKVIAAKMISMSKKQAQGFYAVQTLFRFCYWVYVIRPMHGYGA
jgi:nucleoside-diphosphate kinase